MILLRWKMSVEWCGDKQCSGGAISWCDVDGSVDVDIVEDLGKGLLSS